ncbi:MAG: CoB--CoM heterodisulfide reductase iron-sulfur subunit A family protein [Deltaproteobacteria bacterium]|nr:CoB--CoM heterodisulfide reductase iron-sulfur subunit A family protein [Deltaproteobacteria bacterium]MBW2120504.1 CoB--CoM heterodisulfide reductase iron-sulfur subunit A family protein [Deltaproteobacteria bacterium]
MKRLGVFVCHCGVNIAGTVDVKKVAHRMGMEKDVVHSTDYIYMCSDPGQQLIRDAIREQGLDGVIVACCSPNMHENTFRKAVQSEGLNPYQCEIANIREQCSWVHQKEKEKATEKAEQIIAAVLQKVRGNLDLEAIRVPVNKRVLVVGGGITGITAALDLAEGGYRVVLVDRLPSAGGRMLQLAETFPHLEDATSILAVRLKDIEKNPLIRLETYAEIEETKGYVGNFHVRIRRNPRYVDLERCSGCGRCLEVCPVEVPSLFDRGLASRKAVYFWGERGVPHKPVIDGEACLHFQDATCRACAEICPDKAIRFDQEPLFIEEDVGAIVMATGYDLFPLAEIGEYGYGRIPDVIDGLAFERMLSPDGPTGGQIRRPSDGKIPREVVFIKCVASRDPERYMPYCSRVCCMYTAKHAMLYKRKVKDGQAYVFYMDIRTDSKGYEEFFQETVEQEKPLYLRGRVARVFQDGEKIRVWGTDTLSNRKIELTVDMVVLATAMVPSRGVRDLAASLRATTDKYGFLTEAHIKLYPVESSTRGIYLAGCGQGPKDITDSVAQAGATAGKIQALLSAEKLVQDPLVASVDENVCSGCGICVEVCPYEAREIDSYRRIAMVHEALCQGCGACVASCPNNACELKNSTSVQVGGMIETFAG